MKSVNSRGILDGGSIHSDVKYKKSNHSVSSLKAGILCLYVVLLYLITTYVDTQLPVGLKLENEAQNPEAFIAERAQSDLKKLTDLGPRIVGTKVNDIIAVEMIENILNEIKNKANSVHEIEIETELVSGSYYLDYRPFGGYNTYGNVTNIMLRIKGTNANSKGILVNAHFDSVPTSPGGSDDGINCAAMFEIIRKLVQMPERPQHSIHFLFNGAEESFLQASHGFITTNKWMKDIGVLINLEAAGSGGKEILFQSGPGHHWLLNYYKNVPHPHGQVAGEEIFQSNLIPSDTDFRIFRDFGGLVGYDMAFARNGYRYHTKYDDFDSIPLGSYQHVGDNTLHLIKSLSNAEELNALSKTSKKAVYFDFIGQFMISYSETMAVVVNLLVSGFSLFAALLTLKKFGLKINGNTIKYFLTTVGVVIAGWICAVAITLFMAMFLDRFNHTMSWYGKPWMLIGLYIIPSCVFNCLPMMLWIKCKKESKFGINIESQLIILSNRLIWTFILIIGTCFNIRSSYVIMIPVFFNSVCSMIVLIFNQKYSTSTWRILYDLLNSFPTMMIMYQAILVLSLFIPITGRIGSDRNPEIIVGMITCLVTILISSFFVHYVPLFKKNTIIFAPLIIVFITLGLVFSPIGFPYSGDNRAPSPQRYMIYHTNRHIYDQYSKVIKEDSGFYVINMDRNAPKALLPFINDIDQYKLKIGDCEEILVCGLPLPSPRVLAIMKEQLWIPGSPHSESEEKINLTVEVEQISPTIREYKCVVDGPSHNNIFFSPKEPLKLINISLSDVVPKNVATWNNRSIYFINYSTGYSRKSLEFTLQFETPLNWRAHPALDIALAAHEFNKASTYYEEFMNKFPNWTDIIPVVSTFKSWIV